MARRSNSFEHWLDAQNVCVIGAGTMGGGIAAHLANLGFKVTLLDINREAAEAGLARLRSSRPPHFYLPETALGIRIGSIEDNLAWAAEADWVCEAIVERLDAKRELFAKLDSILDPQAMVSTNTSGLEISLLAEGRSPSFASRFIGTHFFNPPRYLRLLELIPTSKTDPEAIETFQRFLEDRVARRVVIAKDTPGFIANRFGMWSMFHAVHVAERLHLTIEEVDAITGPFLGRPKSGSFRLNDIVGLDIMADIAANLIARCPKDPFAPSLNLSTSMRELLGKGWIGEKSGQGYYKKEGKDLLALDLATFAYRQRQEPSLPAINALGRLPIWERIQQALDSKDEVGEFLRAYLVPLLQYADKLKEEISHSVLDFDRVMMWGFGWTHGPFAMIDGIGPERLGIESKPFYSSAGILTFKGSYAKPPAEPQFAMLGDFDIISRGEAHNLRDLGDGVVAFGLTTKMGSITPTAIRELTSLLESGKISRLVLTSEAKVYSVGFDLNFFVSAIESGDTSLIGLELQALQRLGSLLEQIPSAAAIWGHALGAGLELAMSCSHIAANSECQIGLPEAKVGLIPGGRGTVLMRLRSQGSARELAEKAMMLTAGTVSSNADQAMALGYLRISDRVVYHPDRLLENAKQLALSAKPSAVPNWTPAEGPIGGMIDRLQDQAQSKGELSDYDATIGDRIKAVFVKPQSLEGALRWEREEFIELCGRPLTIARIKHMLEHGKPLRN